jgi:hypothetical protein
MIDNTTLSMFRERYKALTADGKGDDYNSARSLTLGLVVNTDDPLEEGRLQIFCPALNDNPKKIQHLPWCAYVTPFGGSINNKNFTRGVGDGIPVSEGAIHYGFWGVADLGAHVLVGCIDGDTRRRFWIGCIPEHQETHTQFNGRFDWSAKNGTPDGPLTSSKGEIQPLYDNWTKAFTDRTSSEWKSRGADYQVSAISVDGNGSPSKVKGDEYLDESYQGMSSHEKDEWVAAILGAHGYDWSGYKGVGAFKASRVFGMSTPGFHSFSMDDRPFNSRIKFRTASGHLFLMDDTNERIYLMTNRGKSWVEMDSNGNIDVFSENRVSIASASDINLTTQGSIRMHAAESIHMYAGHNDDGDTGASGILLEEPPVKGEIRIHAETDFHQLSTNHRQKTIENHYSEVGQTHYNLVGDSSVTTVRKDISVSTVEGDHIMSSGRNIQATSANDTKHFALGKTSLASHGDAEMHSFKGGTAISAAGVTNIKSMNDNVHMQAGATSGSKNIILTTTNSQQAIGDKGIQSISSAPINNVSGDSVTHEAIPGTRVTSTSGISGPYGLGLGNIHKISLTNIESNAALGDIIHKTASTGHSYNALSTQIDTLTSDVNLLTYQTSVLSSATSSALSALGGSLTLSFSFDVGCLTGKLFDLLPAGLLSVYGSLAALNAQLLFLGQELVTLETLVSRLSDTSLLGLLGLPTNLSFAGINFGSSPCVPGFPIFTGNISSPNVSSQLTQNLRDLINSIYQNGAAMGSPPPLTPLDDSKPCPLTIGPPAP